MQVVRRAAMFIGIAAIFLGVLSAAIGFYLEQWPLFLVSGALGVVGVLSVIRQIRHNLENRQATREEIDEMVELARQVWSRFPDKSARFVLQDQTWQLIDSRIFIYVAKRLYLQITLGDAGEYQITIFKSNSHTAPDQTVRLWHVLRANEVSRRALQAF